MINADLNAQSQFQDFLAATEAGAAALGLAHGRDGPSSRARIIGATGGPPVSPGSLEDAPPRT